MDVLLAYDAPAGVVFPRHLRGLNWPSEAAGLDALVRDVRPRVCFFGHHHTRIDAEVTGVPCVGLNQIRMPGNLVAIDLREGGDRWTRLGEWP